MRSRTIRLPLNLLTLVLVASLLAAGCRDRQPPRAESGRANPGQAGPPAGATGGRTRIEMRNVLFQVLPDSAMLIESLSGRLRPTGSDRPPTFDDPTSFSIDVDSARIAVAASDLGGLMNGYVLNYPGAPLENVRVSTEGSELRQTGTLKKKVPVHFEMRWRLVVTPEGKLLLHPTAVKAAELPVKGIMNLFDIEMDEVIKVDPSRGLTLKGNDMILDPCGMAPPPHMRCRLTGVEIGDDRIEMVFGKPPAVSPKERGSMAFRGGTLRFGKLTMRDSDLRMIDADPHDPVHFFLKTYNQQLVAGYSKNTPALGLRVFIPDLEDVHQK